MRFARDVSNHPGALIEFRANLAGWRQRLRHVTLPSRNDSVFDYKGKRIRPCGGMHNCFFGVNHGAWLYGR